MSKQVINVRVQLATKDWLHQEAAKHGYVYSSGGALGAFLDAIARGEYIILPQDAWKKLSESA